MKNKFLYLFISLLVFFPAFTQTPVSSFSSGKDASHIAAQIVKAAGRDANFLVKAANVPNAAAVLYKGKRYIFYNPGFIEKLTRLTGTPWAGISVLAHEIGHHLHTHVVNGKTIPMGSELEADKFSGFVLQKMGASLEEAQAAIKMLATTRATRTHPARDDRLSSIASGWNHSAGLSPVIASSSSTIEQRSIPVNKPVLLDESQILADIVFNADPGSRYYLTSRYNVVTVRNEKIYNIGKLARLKNSNYPYMIYDNDVNHLFIESSGKIVNKRGNEIGKFQA
ncbi:MAG TPA: hypothetical protein VFX58_14040, partial [Chitinophagaceae bacterium]|nr:hypothetical protein [Chitinophagaceae bacterium]